MVKKPVRITKSTRKPRADKRSIFNIDAEHPAVVRVCIVFDRNWESTAHDMDIPENVRLPIVYKEVESYEEFVDFVKEQAAHYPIYWVTLSGIEIAYEDILDEFIPEHKRAKPRIYQKRKE